MDILVFLAEVLMGKGRGVICKMPIIFELQREYLRSSREVYTYELTSILECKIEILY